MDFRVSVPSPEREKRMSSKLLYVSPDEADALSEGRDDAAFWKTLAGEEKFSLLCRAGELLDACMIWNGIPAKPGQSLRWPRRGVTDADGVPVSDSVIPDAVKRAVCEQAFWLGDPERKKFRRLNRSGIRSASLGGLSVSMNGENAGETVAREALNCVRMFGRLRSDCSESSGGRSCCGSLMRG